MNRDRCHDRILPRSRRPLYANPAKRISGSAGRFRRAIASDRVIRMRGIFERRLDSIARGLAGGMSRREALKAGGAALIGGVAMTPADAWGAVTGHCPAHRVKCHGTCCPRGEVCLPPQHKGGTLHCGCPHRQSRCAGKCVNLLSDPHNCGRCGHSCGANQHCQNGTCHCPSGQTICSGACVTLATNPKHCGSCGKACPAGEKCVSGRCQAQCPPGQAICGGACVDQMTDASACGASCVDCNSLPFVAQAHCSNGTCVIDRCAPDWLNCDGNPTNGCEYLGTVCPGT
jgi:Stigma-specific protein, Stig1